MACSKLEAITIYLVNQACGNDIMPAVYRGSLTYAKFITANFITAIFQNFPDGLCVFCANYFITAIFMLQAKYRKKHSNEIISPKNALAKYLANAKFG